MNRNGKIAISQAFILILGIVAISFLIGQSIVVSATDPECKTTADCKPTFLCIEGVCKEDISLDENNNKLTDLKSTTSSVLQSTATGLSTQYLGSKLGLAKVPEATGQISGTTFKGGIQQSFGSLMGETTGFSGWMGSIAVYAAIALAAGYLAGGITKWAGGASEEAQAVGLSVGAGVFAGLVAAKIAVSAGSAGGPIGIVIGVVVAAVIMVLTYDKRAYEVVKYQCLPFVPERGGEHCEECNNGELPCSEYQCKSLGRSCELVNKGTDKELCISVSRGDKIPPKINPWEKPLPDGYVYNPLPQNTNFPEQRGVKVVNPLNENGCVPPFTDISFGITLDEPSICKFSTERAATWEEMGSEFFSSGMSDYNHSTHMTFPSRDAAESEGFKYKEGFNEFFVRCEDAEGNQNRANFVFRFCVDESPDLTPPTILNENPLNGAPIAFNKTTIDSTFYLNKPSTCKWDYVDRTYEDMENEMQCAESMGDAVNYQYTMAYPCKTTISGLVNYEENDFYIRCKSYPKKEGAERVVMENSYKYTLRGTRKLEIAELAPNETIRGSADTIPVELYARTAGGENEGESVCGFSPSGQDKTYTTFFNTGSYEHTQELFLPSGVYEYYFKCVDKGGNVDVQQTQFVVESDSVEPIIARAYYEDGFLKLVTNEEANCVYSTFGCDYPFEEGAKLSGNDQINHFTTWDTETNLYIKCEDVYQNRPTVQSECSMIVRPYDQFIAPESD